MPNKHAQDRLDKLHSDEPCFILRATDKLAPTTIEVWCDIAAIMGVPQAKINAARLVAQEMRDWQNGATGFKKLPD